MKDSITKSQIGYSTNFWCAARLSKPSFKPNSCDLVSRGPILFFLCTFFSSPRNGRGLLRSYPVLHQIYYHIPGWGNWLVRNLSSRIDFRAINQSIAFIYTRCTCIKERQLYTELMWPCKNTCEECGGARSTKPPMQVIINLNLNGPIETQHSRCDITWRTPLAWPPV